MLRVDGTGGRRPPSVWGVWGPHRHPAGYRGSAPVGGSGGEGPGSKMDLKFLR